MKFLYLSAFWYFLAIIGSVGIIANTHYAETVLAYKFTLQQQRLLLELSKPSSNEEDSFLKASKNDNIYLVK